MRIHLGPVSPRRLAALLGCVAALALIAYFWPQPPPRPGQPTRSDTLRSVLLIEQLEARGFVVQEAAVHRDLVTEIQTLRDSTDFLARARADLARQVETLGGRLHAVTELHAEAETALRLSGEAFVADSSASIEVEKHATPDSVRWTYADSTFGLDATYLPPDTLDVHRLSARVSAALAWTETPDRRLVVSAIPSDSRVHLSLEMSAYQLPDMPTGTCSRWCRLGLRGQGALLGLIVGVVGWELAR